jgi:hypothetical protein
MYYKAQFLPVVHRLLRVTGCKTPSENMFSELLQIADIVRSAFSLFSEPSGIAGHCVLGSEQFHAELWPNNATRLFGIDWLCAAKRA